MTTWTKTAILAAMLACAGTCGAQAQSNPAQASRTPLVTSSILLANQNSQGNSIWWSFYDSSKSKIVLGCLIAGKTYTMPNNVTAQVERIGFFFVRGEVKANQNCTGETLSDSGMGAAIQLYSNRQTVVKLR